MARVGPEPSALGAVEQLQRSSIMTMSLVFAVAIAAISMTCVAAAAFLAWHQRRGWGWFLFVGFLVAATLPNVTKIVLG
jgi:ABC-type glycerol-3-phosphate transport system permease component